MKGRYEEKKSEQIVTNETNEMYFEKNDNRHCNFDKNIFYL